MSNRHGRAMIVYVSSFDVTSPDGPGVNEQMFVMSLGRILGPDVRFVIPQPSGTLPEGFPEDRCVFLPPVEGRRFLPWIWHQWKKLGTMRAIKKRLRPSLIVIRPDVLPAAELLFTAGGDVPFCTKNAHISFKASRTAAGFFGQVMKLHFYLLERLFERAAAVDVVSEIQRADILEALSLDPTRVRVTDNAVDCRRFRPRDKAVCRSQLGLNGHQPLIGYVGNLAAQRGATEIIRALPALKQHFPDAGALIVEGDGRSTAELRALAQQLNVADSVVFRGPVPLSQVPDYLGALDVAVSLREDDGCSELKVRQYIACGRPAVVSAQVNEFVERADLGSVVDRHDQQSVQEALIKWAERGATPEQSEALAERLAAYASDKLDTDPVNRERLAAFREAAIRAAQQPAGQPE